MRSHEKHRETGVKQVVRRKYDRTESDRRIGNKAAAESRTDSDNREVIYLQLIPQFSTLAGA